MGAALAYYALFSLAPLLLMVIAIAGVVLGHGPAQLLVLGGVERQFGSESAQALRLLMEHAAPPLESRVASALSLVILIMGALGVVGELQASLNVIWRTPARPGALGEYLRKRLASLTLVFAIGFLVLVSLALSALAAVLGHTWSQLLPFPEIALPMLQLGVSFVVLTLMFASIFKFLPQARVAWGDVWVGAAATSLLFTLGNVFLGLYLGKIGIASAYGAAGALVAFVAWAYYGAQILYFGAELTHAYAEAKNHPEESPGEKGIMAVAPSGEGVFNVVTTLLK